MTVACPIGRASCNIREVRFAQTSLLDACPFKATVRASLMVSAGGSIRPAGQFSRSPKTKGGPVQREFRGRVRGLTASRQH